jgi:hypothetical protein
MMTIEILTYGIGAGVVGDITTKAERGGLMGVFQGREYIRHQAHITPDKC